MIGPVGGGGVYSLTPVQRGTRVTPVSTQNRFLPLDSDGRGHKTEITLADFGVKPKLPRRGRSGRPATCGPVVDSKAVLIISEQGVPPRVPGAPTGSDASAPWTSRVVPSYVSVVTAYTPASQAAIIRLLRPRLLIIHKIAVGKRKAVAFKYGLKCILSH